MICASHLTINAKGSFVWGKPAVLHSSQVTRRNIAPEFGQGGDLGNLLYCMHGLWDIAQLFVPSLGAYDEKVIAPELPA